MIAQIDNKIGRLAFTSAIDPMWIIRIEGENAFRFAAINHTFTTITGWQEAQVVGQPMETIIPPASHALVREKYNEAISTGSIVDYIEESAHPAGVKYGQIRVIPLQNAEGKIDRLLGIAHDITDKTMLREALLAERDRKNKQITAAAIRGQELERSRVSRELHDNVNQVLTTVKLYTELCVDGKVDYLEVLPKCTALLVSTINEIRILSKQLSAPSIGSLSYEESITELVDSMKQTLDIGIDLHLELSDCLEMESELHLTLYRILQEQFTNIHKYASAAHVAVDLRIRANRLQLRITDDGVGFDTRKKSAGIGITNMQSRTQLLHGSFEMRSQAGKGTEVEVHFPVRIVDGICSPDYV